MEAPLASFGTRKAPRKQIETAVEVLKGGGIVAVPTDTLYGLAAPALSERAVERVFQAKGRPSGAPLPLLLADTADLSRFAAEVPELAWDLAEAFFPGPLTLVMPRAQEVPAAVSGGLQTIALRIPGHWVPRAIARELGSAITGTSANRTGMPAATTAEEVRRQLGDQVDYVIDGGRCDLGVASTVVDLSGASPTLVREGAVSRREIEKVCGRRGLELGRELVR